MSSQTPTLPTRKRAIAIASVMAGVAFAAFVVYGIIAPDISRPTPSQVQATNNVKQLLSGLHIYAEYNDQRFPPAYSTGPENVPLLSWRVQLLPYIEHARLYKRFHLDEPWDSPHNRSLITEMPSIYYSTRGRRSKLPGETGTTPYLAMLGPRSAFSADTPSRLADFKHAVVLVEVDEAHEVVWTRPDDFALDSSALGRLRVSNGRYLMGFGDRSVQYPAASLTLHDLQALANPID